MERRDVPSADGGEISGALADPAGAAPRIAGAESPRLKHAALLLFVVYAVAWTSFLGYLWASHPGLHHGDSFSDANVLSGGRNFDRFGIGLNYGLPTHRATPAPGRPAAPYTHYPPGPEWIHQALKAGGLHQLWQFRLVAVAAAGLALALLFVVVTQLTRRHVVALLAAFFYSWSAPFAQYADSLHQHAYMQLTLFAFFAAWLAYERAQTRRARRLWLALAGLAAFVDLWLTFEHVLFVPIFALARTLLVGRRRDLRGLVLVGCMPILVLALRIGHNSLALGGVQAACRDMFAAARYRAAPTEEPLAASALLECWRTRLGGSALRRDHHDVEFAYPLLRSYVWLPAALLGMALVCTGHWKRQASARRGVGSAVVLLVAGAAWSVAMRNHVVPHRHTIMLLLPGLALLLASLTAAGLRLWCSAPRRALRRLVGPALAGIVLVGFGLHLRRSVALNFVYPFDNKVHHMVAERCQRLEGLSRAADGCLRDARRIYFLYGMYPELAYQIGRPYEFYSAELPAQLDADEVVWIEYWSDTERQLAWQAFRRCGFPDMPSPPNEYSLAFWGRPRDELTTDIPYEGACRLARLRWSSTLDGESWLLQALYCLPESAAEPSELTHTTALVAADGSLGQVFDWQFGWGMREGRAVIACSYIPKSAFVPGARLRLGLWSSAENRALKPDVEHAVLPPNAAWDSDHDAFYWDPAPTRSPAPPKP